MFIRLIKSVSTAAMVILHPVLRRGSVWGAAMMAELRKREEEAGIIPEQALDMFMRATAVQVRPKSLTV